MTKTLFDIDVRDLMQDVYFQKEFTELHAFSRQVEMIELDDFRHVAVVQGIPGTPYTDLETAWGYGGPVGLTTEAVTQGLHVWRARQKDNQRIAEFIRLHPFVDGAAYDGMLDRLKRDRLTVAIDLVEPAATRWRHYSKATRYCIRQAQKNLKFRTLGLGEGAIFKSCYEAGLAGNSASEHYYFPAGFFNELLASPLAITWVAEQNGEPVAVSCFLHRSIFCHYHLSGGHPRARDAFASYGLLETAIEEFAGRGARWMHLGGGRTAAENDPLYVFKCKFSPLRAPFYIGGLIHVPEIYRRLTAGRDGQFLNYRFVSQPRADAGPSQDG